MPRPNRNFEKSKDFKGTWGKIINYCKSYIPAIVIAIICSIISTVLTLIGPDKLKEITNLIAEGIMTGIDMDGVKKIGFILIAFYVIGYTDIISVC